jgi:1-acyl-sn-glycerol-3-phosphate acyltransferase
MAFVIAVALASAVALIRWQRSGQTFREVVFFGVMGCYAQFWHRCRAPRIASFPRTGPVILISNHTSSPDCMFLQFACSGRLLGWLASREHYESHRWIRKLLDTLHCVPVRRNGQDATAARAALRRLQEGRALCIFPEGNLSGTGRGIMRSPKAGAAWLALRSGAPVVPAYIAGGPQTHRLLQAWVWPSRKAARVYLGEPIDLSAFRALPLTRKLVEDVAQHLMEQVLALAPAAQRTRMKAG